MVISIHCLLQLQFQLTNVILIFITLFIVSFLLASEFRNNETCSPLSFLPALSYISRQVISKVDSLVFLSSKNIFDTTLKQNIPVLHFLS